jgi:hypothetical protein
LKQGRREGQRAISKIQVLQKMKIIILGEMGWVGERVRTLKITSSKVKKRT